MSVLRACRIAAVTLLAVLAALATASSAYAIDTSFPYQMNPKHNDGKCIDVPDATAANVGLIQFTCKNSTNQRFRFIDKGEDTYEIRAVHSDKCLDVTDGSQDNRATVGQFPCNDQPNQRFRLLKDEASPGASTPIQAVHSNKCLDVENASNANRARLIQFTCNDLPHQKFVLLALAG